jgi:hypothetical protein
VLYIQIENAEVDLYLWTLSLDALEHLKTERVGIANFLSPLIAMLQVCKNDSANHSPLINKICHSAHR